MKIFDFVPSWAYALAIAFLLGAWGVAEVRVASVKREFANYRAEVAENTLKAEAAARAKEHEFQKRNERISNEASKRERRLAASAATSELAVGSLRNEINRLNAGAVSADSGAAGTASNAAAARELLGSCATEYRAVAQGADELRNQVIGLQEWVAQVCRDGQK